MDLESTVTTTPLENTKASVVVPCAISIAGGASERENTSLRNSAGYNLLFITKNNKDKEILPGPQQEQRIVGN